MAASAEWKKAFIDNTIGHGMDAKTNIDRSTTEVAGVRMCLCGSSLVNMIHRVAGDGTSVKWCARCGRLYFKVAHCDASIYTPSLLREGVVLFQDDSNSSTGEVVMVMTQNQRGIFHVFFIDTKDESIVFDTVLVAKDQQSAIVNATIEAKEVAPDLDIANMKLVLVNVAAYQME